MLENNPVLRERVLGVTAVAAILFGGVVGFDTMLTSGWQFGASDDARATYAAMTPQQYFDDVSRDWSVAPPRRVQLASADPMSATQTVENLDGASGGVISLVSTAPTPTPAATPQASADQALAAQSRAADQHFDAIEADIRQATSQLEQTEPAKASEPSTPSDNQG